MTNSTINSTYHCPSMSRARKLIDQLEQVAAIASIENVVVKIKSTLVVTSTTGFVTRIVYSTSVIERAFGGPL